MKSKTLVALLLCAVMFIGMLPMSIMAYYEEALPDEGSLEVCIEGKTYSLFTEDNLEGQNGTTFLYVVKSGDRYYTLGNPRYTEFKEVDSVYAVDITEYYDAETNTFTGIPDSANVGAMQYQMNSGSYMYVDGDMLFALSVPFESEGNTWFEGGIRYYEPENTYSYSRPSWHSKGDGTGYFYDSYIDWFGDSDEWAYGVLDLKYTGTSYVFALRDKSAEYTAAKNAEPDNYDISVDVTAYLYAAPCGHEQNSHTYADAPTCVEKGCHEYWYCRLCDTYFSDESMTVAFDGFPEIDALGHDFDGEKCKNCNRPVPVYSKVTNKTDFSALADDTMYVLVAEYEGKYYTPDSSLLYSYVFDLDEDGYADIYNVDENNNGTPDIAEIDWDENGVYDLWDYQTEEERREYFDSICHGYLTDMLYGQTVGIPVKEITLNPDGTISHDAVKDALEFEMIKLHSQEEINDSEEVFRYTYECVMQFVVPNTFINSPAFIPEDRPYGKLYPDYGDTYYWAVLFYNDRDSYYTYNWENDEYVGGLPFLDICKEGSIALSKSWNTFSPEFGEQLGCLRLRDYNGKLSFVVGNDYDLEGSEWVDDENGGYCDTHDKQACVYLYASAPYESAHTCDFGDWVDDGNGRTHTHTCKDSSCGKTETESHDWDNGVETKAPTCTEEGTKTYTCGDCRATKTEPIPKLDHTWDTGVETKAPTCTEDGIKTFTCTKENCGATKTEPISALDHDWSEWTYDSVDSHIRHCKRENCNAEDYNGHEWGSWTPVDDNTHKMTCSVCSGYQTDEHDWGEGVVTKEPTEWETGIKTYTCTDCKHTKTESIDKLVHECVWTDWYPNGDENHKRDCMDDNCDKFETLPHEWDDGVITTPPTEEAEGIKTYTCQVCMHEKTESVPKIEHVHNFGDWTYDDGNTHSKSCACGETQTEDHHFGDGEVIQGPTHLAVGQIKYTCADCFYEKFVDMPIIPDHEWSNWVDLDNDSHVRECICGERETEDHDFDDGEITKEPTEEEEGILTYTCEICGHEKTEAIDKETHIHDWSEWKENGNGAHSRYCNCGESETDDHEFDDGKVVSNPSHLEEGLKVYTCSVCNAVSEEILDKTPDHSFIDGKCECGEEDPNYVPPHEHNFVNGKCECGEEDPNYVAPHEHKFGDWICEATVVGKHYRECECGERESGDCSWDNGKISLDPTYDAYGERTYTCTLCGGTKTESIDMLVKVEEIIFPDNEDVKVTVPEGSSATIAEGTTLEVEQVEEEVSETVKENVSAAIGEDKIAEVLAEFDIDLVLNGANVQPGGEIEVTIPIPENAAAYNDLQVVYIDDNGNVTPCETTVNDDGTVTFVTDHFSRYAIIGINDAKVDNPPTDEPEIPFFVWIISLVVGLAIIIGCVVGPLYAKKKATAGVTPVADEKNDAPEVTEDAEKPEDDTIFEETEATEETEE